MFWLWIAVAFFVGMFFIRVVKLLWHTLQIALEFVGEWWM